MSKHSAGVYEQFGIRRAINARSYSTKVGGCVLEREVVDAMRAASESCVRIEDLQQAASRVIAESTGAEAGIVTSGASGALTLAAAACITGLDVSRMNRLPDTLNMKSEVVVHRSHRNDYDHALRLAGARLMEVGFSYCTFPYEVEAAITDRTAAMFYLAEAERGVVPLAEFVSIAHRHHLPVIVDAAAALPPPSNLKSFIAAGADLVTFSGGKHLRGPQASGILCGRKDLILAATLQHQDMDVFPATWSYRNLIEAGIVAGPPHHGVGRGFKVGKEEIVGLLTALRLYSRRDFDAERSLWWADMETVVAAVQGVAGLAARVVFPHSNGRPVPNAHITLDPKVCGVDAHCLVNALQEGDPQICVSEGAALYGTVIVMPEALQPGDAETVGRRIREILAAGA